MSDTIFMKIIRGEIPCHKVYEDDQVLAFLDIRPVNPGHTLVIPKTPVDHFSDLDDPTTQAVMRVVQNISRTIRATLKPQRVALMVIGDEVPHAHVHVVPYHHHGDVTSLRWQQPATAPDHQALAKIAEQLRQGL